MIQFESLFPGSVCHIDSVEQVFYVEVGKMAHLTFLEQIFTHYFPFISSFL